VFRKALKELGWTEAKNIQIDYRWASNDAAQIPTFANELLSLKPDVILAQGALIVATLQRERKTTPIVFVTRNSKLVIVGGLYSAASGLRSSRSRKRFSSADTVSRKPPYSSSE